MADTNLELQLRLLAMQAYPPGAIPGLINPNRNHAGYVGEQQTRYLPSLPAAGCALATQLPAYTMQQLSAASDKQGKQPGFRVCYDGVGYRLPVYVHV